MGFFCAHRHIADNYNPELSYFGNDAIGRKSIAGLTRVVIIDPPGAFVTSIGRVGSALPVFRSAGAG